jgi:hypothetical protein
MTIERRLDVVWVALMLVTVVTTWLLQLHAVAATVGTLGTLAFASWKVRLIVLEFMELRHAPAAGRALFELWSIGAPLMIAAFYLTS